jgi:hypothetical protein
MATCGHNEGFRVLEEFTCDAIPVSDPALDGSRGRGVNTDMDVLTEMVVRPAPAALNKERIAELRAMSNAQLLALIRSSGSELSRKDLLAIQDIAAERSTNGSGASAQDALELSRAAMLVAVNRTG